MITCEKMEAIAKTNLEEKSAATASSIKVGMIAIWNCPNEQHKDYPYVLVSELIECKVEKEDTSNHRKSQNIKIKVIDHKLLECDNVVCPFADESMLCINDSEITSIDKQGFQEIHIINDINKPFKQRFLQLQKLDLRLQIMDLQQNSDGLRKKTPQTTKPEGCIWHTNMAEQTEIVHHGTSILLTPSLGNCHAIFSNNKGIIENDLQYLYNNHINWKLKNIEFAMIPESLLKWHINQWKKNRNDKFCISNECYVYRLEKSKSHWLTNTNFNFDVSSNETIAVINGIIYKPLSMQDVSNVMKLNNDQSSYDVYVKRAIKSKLPSIGAYCQQSDQLVGCCIVHLDDLSVGALAVNPEFRRRSIATILVQIVTYAYFELNRFDFINANIEIDNQVSQRFFTSMGFEKQPQKYYFGGN